MAFYTQFGFRPVRTFDSPDGAFAIRHLQLGAAILEIFCFRNSEPAPDTSLELATDLPRRGAKHLGLQVSDIKEAREFVLDRGIADVVEIVRGKTGVEYFFIKDPDGILMEILQDDLLRQNID